ncbi:hypothetical protein MMC08_003638, partial [Hypocenomyce scalaris]|nr:hypothetical protein [Hypocenomyce scalaris]
AALFLDLAAGFPPLSWFINTILPGWLRAQRAKSLRFVQEKLSARLSKESERPDFVSYVLRYNDERGINRDEMDSNFDLFTIAGSETTATLLAGCTYHLLRNPGVLQRLNDEVRTGFSSAADITIAAANKLPYLLAVLEESLRMHPPVPAGASRIVPPGGSTISGCWVPGGTLVTIPQFAAYHSPNNFAKPTSFIPSRWLEKHEPIFDNDRKAIFQPFSAGPRNCIGKNLAYAEMKLILAKMVWHFDMELVTTEGNWADQKVYLVFQRTQLLVKLTPRVQ